jgi:hypothetical protein
MDLAAVTPPSASATGWSTWPLATPHRCGPGGRYRLVWREGGRCRAGAIGTRRLPPAERRWPTRAWPDAAVGGQTRVGHHWPTAVGCLSAAQRHGLPVVVRPPSVVRRQRDAVRWTPSVARPCRTSSAAYRRRAGTGRTPPARRRWLDAPGRPPPTACHGEGPPPAGDRPPRAARRRLPVGRMPPAVRRRRDAANQTSPTAGPPSERHLPPNPPKTLAPTEHRQPPAGDPPTSVRQAPTHPPVIPTSPAR